MDGTDKIEELKQLLLDVDLDKLEKVDLRLKEVVLDLYTKERLAQLVDPLVDSKLVTFQEEIPEKMGPTITAALRKQINDSQQEVIDALYPIMGKLIRKFIRIEIEKLAAKIDSQFHNFFSWKKWKIRFKSWFGGSKESALILNELNAPKIQDIFMISKGSGILLGNYSKSSTMDKDMVAGMLTAIKSFAEDAFKKDTTELEMIEYESFKIKIFNFSSFYFAVTITGVINTEFSANLHNQIFDFVDLKLRKEKIDIKEYQHFSEDLSSYFNGK